MQKKNKKKLFLFLATVFDNNFVFKDLMKIKKTFI
jgi:hypothetical protein